MSVNESLIEHMVDDLLPFEVEIHLRGDPDFPKKYGKRVKEAGGKYSDARRVGASRYVELPSSAGELINTILKECDGADNRYRGTVKVRRTTVIYRSLGSSAATDCVMSLKVDEVDNPMGSIRRHLVNMTLRARARGQFGADAPITRTEKAEKGRQETARKAQEAAVGFLQAQRAVEELQALLATPEGPGQLVMAMATGSNLSDILLAVIAKIKEKMGAEPEKEMQP
jgi:hypothetical protein